MFYEYFDADGKKKDICVLK